MIFWKVLLIYDQLNCPVGNESFSDCCSAGNIFHFMLFSLRVDILQEIQKQRIYGSHLRYVVSLCPYNASQEPRDCTEETVFNFARFQIPAQQEITTRIWSKNEIGTSRDFALIRIPSEDECKHVVL